jgi:hypothetical protein
VIGDLASGIRHPAPGIRHPAAVDPAGVEPSNLRQPMLLLVTGDEQVGPGESRHRHLDHVTGPHHEPAAKLEAV